jgi:hypothetical protein
MTCTGRVRRDTATNFSSPALSDRSEISEWVLLGAAGSTSPRQPRRDLITICIPPTGNVVWLGPDLYFFSFFPS